MSRDMRALLRLSMQNSDGTSTSNIDPERAQWLKNAMESISVDLPKQLREDIDMLTQLLSAHPVDQEDCLSLVDDILNLTEEIDLANDFFKMGGVNLLLRMLFESPLFIKSAAYRLLANTTQNNPYGQMACLEKNILPRLINLIPDEDHPGCVKDLLLAVSCLTRGHTEAVRIFHNENGLSLITQKMRKLASQSGLANPEIVNVWRKASFLIYCLLQEAITIMTEENKRILVHELVHLLIDYKTHPQEHLLASMILLLTNSSSLTDAIDSENVSEALNRYPHLISPDDFPAFRSWLQIQDDELAKSDDSANAEVQSYIGVLRRLLDV